MIPAVNTDEPFALLENTRDAVDSPAYLFRQPVAEVICHRGAEVSAALADLERLRQQGLYLCGYLAYEAAYFIADKQSFQLAPEQRCDTPLIHFYAFSEREVLTASQAQGLLASLASGPSVTAIRDLQLNMTQAAYTDALEQVRTHIRDGDSYQVNYTLKYRFDYQGSAPSLYQTLRASQSVEFAAYLNFPEFSVLSISPELFIRKQGSDLLSRPMKGTAARGQSAEQDREIVAGMRSDPKTLSENVMIVDLMRNDLSRIASKGTVSVEKLFEVQTFETLHQMISTVKGQVDPQIGIDQVLAGLFPCGSITGAPKLRTMEIIEQLEVERRGIYTGAIGYLTPDNDFCFNVPIRTCLAYPDGRAEMGVGGGILYESDPQAEFDECRLKARFLAQLNRRFKLIESLLYDAASGSIALLDLHLERLADSARRLHFSCDTQAIRHQLSERIATLQQRSKVRLLLSQDGQIEISAEPVSTSEVPTQPLVDIAAQRVDSADWLYQHKTTERDLYNQAYAEHSAQGAYDVLFLNDAGFVTEASRHNLFIELHGRLITPPVSDAVLPGVYRQKLISEAKLPVEIRSIGLKDLLAAERILLTNAVRGVVDVSLSRQALDAAQAIITSGEN